MLIAIFYSHKDKHGINTEQFFRQSEANGLKTSLVNLNIRYDKILHD